MTFTRRPTSVPPDLRPEWRLPLLLLIVRHCRGQTASREQLSILNSAILRPESRRALLAALGGRLTPETPIAQFEPALDRAIDRAVGLGLLIVNAHDRLELTTVGRTVLRTLDSDDNLFVNERELLKSLPKALSQATIRKALTERRVT